MRIIIEDIEKGLDENRRDLIREVYDALAKMRGQHEDNAHNVKVLFEKLEEITTRLEVLETPDLHTHL